MRLSGENPIISTPHTKPRRVTTNSAERAKLVNELDAAKDIYILLQICGEVLAS